MMAGLVRLKGMQNLVGRLASTSKLSVVNSNRAAACSSRLLTLRRAVGTSSSSKAGNVAEKAQVCPTPGTASKIRQPKEEIWVSYGYCKEDKWLDRHQMHMTMFVSICILTCGGAFLLAYLPDFKMKDWALREAYLRLRDREARGLPPIDCNIVDPALVKLPTDEELGDTEIII
ncbi:hypothetical protein TKK_0013445 [Trichogramma kaykai]|uniref:NADH dehydrogenase [ubiquinone] 1 beta subcomplex subunit 11, mitochondrial n=1 Tax=Trichogramma kaykai TaxID=54128 RepID=A0ABD2WIE0_9HYME